MIDKLKAALKITGVSDDCISEDCANCESLEECRELLTIEDAKEYIKKHEDKQMKITAKSKKADILTAYKKLEGMLNEAKKDIHREINRNKDLMAECDSLDKTLHAEKKVHRITETALKSAESAINYHKSKIEKLERVILGITAEMYGVE